MVKNKLIIAAAGSGKTTFLVQDAFKTTDHKILITTFTEANEAEIKKKIVEKNKCIPPNITVQTWFSFLLQHGVRPYQGGLFPHSIKGMNFVSGQSATYIKESDIERHYFDRERKIYSDKIAKFSVRCNEKCNSDVISRLSRIYPKILIDEVQDLAGYDLEFLKLLFASSINTVLVGDPRQGTYSTSNIAKNKKFKKAAIVSFFDEDHLNVEKDDKSFNTNYRSIPEICDFSNKLFPDHTETTSGNNKRTSHDGIFLVREVDVDKYLSQHSPMQLRESRKKSIANDFSVMNFGESKGLSFDRILIYPTAPIIAWLKNNSSDLAPVSRSKFYVAVTRARFSVAFVYNYRDDEDIPGTIKFMPS